MICLVTCANSRKIELALQALGADLKDIVRTRLLVTKLDKENLDAIARAHRECIVEKTRVSPVCTLIGVAGLAHPDMLCEIETDAFVKRFAICFLYLRQLTYSMHCHNRFV